MLLSHSSSSLICRSIHFILTSSLAFLRYSRRTLFCLFVFNGKFIDTNFMSISTVLNTLFKFILSICFSSSDIFPKSLGMIFRISICLPFSSLKVSKLSSYSRIGIISRQLLISFFFPSFFRFSFSSLSFFLNFINNLLMKKGDKIAARPLLFT